MGSKERRRSSEMKVFLGDYLNLTENEKVQSVLSKNKDSTILFSDVIIKVNKRNKMQERILLMTDNAVYNLDPTSYKVKRKINLVDIGSICLSQLPDNFFALKIPSEYDYLLISTKKCEIITRLADQFAKLMDQNLDVQFSNSFDYRIDNDTVREIHFTPVEGGISTQIYTKAK